MDVESRFAADPPILRKPFFSLSQSRDNLVGNLGVALMKDKRSPRNRIELDGEYDLSRRGDVAELFDAIATNAKELLINMSRVTYVDSSFFNELTQLRKRLNGCRITVMSPRPHLRRLFSILAFDTLFRLVDEE